MKSKTEKTYRMEHAAEGINALFGKIAVVSLVLALGLTSTGYGIVIGDWEGINMDGWVPGWEGHPVLTPGSTTGVTRGTGSLRVQWTGKYWVLQWSAPTVPTLENGTKLSFDVTALPGDFAAGTWVQVADKIAINSDGPSGWKEYQKLAMVTDRITGLPTTRDWNEPNDGVISKTYTLDISDYDLTGATWFQINISVQLSLNGDETGTGKVYFDNAQLTMPPDSNLTVTKCTVTAGKVQGQDAFSASGTTGTFPDDLDDINEIDVNITSLADDEVGYSEPIDFNNSTDVKNGKFQYTHKIPSGGTGGITSLTIDFTKRKFAITAKNIDLTGLACPLKLEFALGSYVLSGDAYEPIVNGPKKLIPIRLMSTYADSLRISKASVKQSTKALSDSLSVSGEIAVEDIAGSNLASQDVNVIWGAQTFKIPSGSFTAKTGHSYKCGKVVPVDSNGLMTVTIDLDKCAYTVSLTKANLDAASEFGLRFGDFNEISELP